MTSRPRLGTRARRTSAPAVLLVAVVAALLAVTGCSTGTSSKVASGSVFGGGGSTGGKATPTPSVSVSTSPSAAPGSVSAATAHARGAFASNPTVAPLGEETPPDVFVRTADGLTQAQIDAVVQATGATHAIAFSTGTVSLGSGTTTAIGIDPSTFRGYSQHVNAVTDALWQTIAAGNAAVQHSVARAQNLWDGDTTHPLAGGIDFTMGAAGSGWDFHLGALMTTAIPGVGVVVSNQYDDLLKLRRNTGLLLVAPSKDPVVVGQVATQTLISGRASLAPYGTGSGNGSSTGDGVTATPVHYATGAGQRWYLPASGPLTQPFMGITHHPGIDIGSTYGRPIWAAAAGVVTYAGPAAGYGNEVIITHAGGVSTVYGHMEKILVTVGQTVQGGYEIALVGSEGESTGPHLHFEVHVNDQLVDPLAWLRDHGVTNVGETSR